MRVREDGNNKRDRVHWDYRVKEKKALYSLMAPFY